MTVYQDAKSCRYLVYEYNAILGIWHEKDHLGRRQIAGKWPDIERFITDNQPKEIAT